MLIYSHFHCVLLLVCSLFLLIGSNFKEKLFPRFHTPKRESLSLHLNRAVSRRKKKEKAYEHTCLCCFLLASWNILKWPWDTVTHNTFRLCRIRLYKLWWDQLYCCLCARRRISQQLSYSFSLLNKETSENEKNNKILFKRIIKRIIIE